MKLREVRNTGSIPQLSRDLFNAMKGNKTRDVENLQAFLVTRLMEKNWQDRDVNKYISAIKSANSSKDVEKMIGRYFASEINESSEIVKYKLSVIIPFVEKSNISAAVKQYLRHLQKNGMKVLKRKIKSSEYNINDQEVANVYVDTITSTNLDRDMIKKVIQPKYKIDKLSYTEKDK